MRHLTTFRLIERVAKVKAIRRAAEDLAITPSALQRRLQAFEDELGVPIFDRLPKGVRLNAAGELVIHHIRRQLADTDRLRSQLADLKGMRRGHISIACSQALASYFLPKVIADYRKKFPAVSFNVQTVSHKAAEQALEEFGVDLALVFEPNELPKFQTIASATQNLRVIMASDHPLADRGVLRLRECIDYPLALPTTSFGGRQLLDKAIASSSLSVAPMIESNSFEFLKQYVIQDHAVCFQIAIGAPPIGSHDGLVTRRLDMRDVEGGMLLLGQRTNRILPVAAARFADDIARRFAAENDSAE